MKRFYTCELCGATMDDNNVYGPPEMELCRRCHDMFYYFLGLMLGVGKIKPRPSIESGFKTAKQILNRKTQRR